MASSTSNPFVYEEKWSLNRELDGFFHNLGAVGFSSSGQYVAFGGVDNLLVATVGKRGAFPFPILRRDGATVVALQWFWHDGLVCAFDDGTICDISFLVVNGKVGVLLCISIQRC